MSCTNNLVGYVIGVIGDRLLLIDTVTKISSIQTTTKRFLRFYVSFVLVCSNSVCPTSIQALKILAFNSTVIYAITLLCFSFILYGRSFLNRFPLTTNLSEGKSNYIYQIISLCALSSIFAVLFVIFLYVKTVCLCKLSSPTIL